jgi:FKBP-type peptidyl-prolyl cis-trans isomerase FkpA
MKVSFLSLAALIAAGMVGCNESDNEPVASAEPVTETVEEQPVTEETANESEIIEVAPGLTAKIMQRGHGRAAEAGDYVEVHYTGWLYDAEAEDNRGDKFDSSVDRGQRFGCEKRELTIAPEMGYGNRGAGNVIPPGATLIFEVELFHAEGPSDAR